MIYVSFFFQAEDGIRDWSVTGVQTCALPICRPHHRRQVAQGSSQEETGFDGAHSGADSLTDLAQMSLTTSILYIVGRSTTRSEERRVGKEWTSRGWW